MTLQPQQWPASPAVDHRLALDPWAPCAAAQPHNIVAAEMQSDPEAATHWLQSMLIVMYLVLCVLLMMFGCITIYQWLQVGVFDKFAMTMVGNNSLHYVLCKVVVYCGRANIA